MPASARTRVRVWKTSRVVNTGSATHGVGERAVEINSDDIDISDTSNSATRSCRQNISDGWRTVAVRSRPSAFTAPSISGRVLGLLESAMLRGRRAMMLLLLHRAAALLRPSKSIAGWGLMNKIILIGYSVIYQEILIDICLFNKIYLIHDHGTRTAGQALRQAKAPHQRGGPASTWLDTRDPGSIRHDHGSVGRPSRRTPASSCRAGTRRRHRKHHCEEP